MKKLILSILLLVSCSQEMQLYHYEYIPDQPNVINVDVVPVGDVRMRNEEMLREVNADYYNRYGIAVDLNFLPKIDVPRELIENEDLKFIPRGQNEKITLFVVQEKYIRIEAALAYVVRYTGNINRADIVIGEHSQTSGTLAHEIGHARSLNHLNARNNVMTPVGRARQLEKPNDFLEQQIDTILRDMSSVPFKSLIDPQEKYEIIIN